MIPAPIALQRLKDGNANFVARTAGAPDADHSPREMRLPQEQMPFAIILGCSDARVPAEIVFDQGPGDLFVIRVAGNIVAPSQLGSIEFAVTNFATRLVVVLGHSRCGAVDATIKALRAPQQATSKNLKTIVSFIKPAVEPLLSNGATDDQEQLIERAVRANVIASVRDIRERSEVLQPLVNNNDVLVVGAEYSLKTGTVEFFDSSEA